MKMFTFSQLKSNLNEIFEMIKSGEEIVVSKSNGTEKLAIILPYEKHHSKQKSNHKRPLGILKGKASFKIKHGFKLAEHELLNS